MNGRTRVGERDSGLRKIVETSLGSGKTCFEREMTFKVNQCGTSCSWVIGLTVWKQLSGTYSGFSE